MKLKNLTAFVFLLFFFVACNDYEKIMGPALKAKMEDKNPNPVFDGEAEPTMPDPKENDKTVLGIDTNNNGIRDDIDIWINRTGKTYNERMALRQLARAYREEWIAGNLAYENFKKGPVNVFNPTERDYNRSISHKIQEATSKEADATMGCMQFIFIKPQYDFDAKASLDKALTKLYENTELRREVLQAYLKFGHTFGVTEKKKHEYDYCLFDIENLEQAKIDYKKYHQVYWDKEGIKNDKK
jgi:hypothetical protein